MAAKKGGLGKGLDSLITDKVNKPGAAKDASLTPTEDQAVMVPINKVELWHQIMHTRHTTTVRS